MGGAAAGPRLLADDMLDRVVGGISAPSTEILQSLIDDGILAAGRVWRPGPG